MIAETNNSWYWRKLLEVRDTFCQLGAVEQIRKKDSYLIMDGYRILTGEHRRDRKFAQVWNPMNVPKHSFILWLVLKQRIMTKERASRFIQLDNIDCSLCKDEAETTQHLFFQCQIVQEWLKEIKYWLGWRTHKTELHDLLLWIQRKKATKFRRRIWLTAVAALVYAVWYQRNRVVWRKEEMQKSEVCKRVKHDVKNRIKVLGTNKISAEDIRWFVDL